VFQVELEVLPPRARAPPVEVVHLHEHADFAVLPDQSIHLRDEVLVVLLGQSAAKLDL